jgi:hypothetical protein
MSEPPAPTWRVKNAKCKMKKVKMKQTSDVRLFILHFAFGKRPARYRRRF